MNDSDWNDLGEALGFLLGSCWNGLGKVLGLPFRLGWSDEVRHVWWRSEFDHYRYPFSSFSETQIEEGSRLIYHLARSFSEDLWHYLYFAGEQSRCLWELDWMHRGLWITGNLMNEILMSWWMRSCGRDSWYLVDSICHKLWDMSRLLWGGWEFK